MAFPLFEEQIKQLQTFVSILKNPAVGPGVLHAPQMDFFREYLLSLGATLPPKPAGLYETKEAEPERPEQEETTAVEENAFDVVDKATQPFGNPGGEASDDNIEKADILKSEARNAASEGDWEKAVKLYTEAIVLNSNASLIAKRAEAFLKLGKPNAAIYDCDKAIQINKNSAGGYYVRGKAKAMVGDWEAALKDMQSADQLDGDCGAYDLLKDYKEKAEEAKQKRLAKEKKKPQPKPQTRTSPREEFADSPPSGGFPFGAGGGGMPNIANLMNDPEIMALLSNPKMQKLIGEVMTDPSKIQQYMADPELAPVITKLMSAFGGAPAPPSGASAARGTSPKPTPRKPADDLDVD